MTIRKQGDWLSAGVGDELVMMSAERGVYIGLSDVGARIWEIIDTSCEIDAICARLCDEFDVTAETCRAEVESFLAELEKQGAITFDQPAGGLMSHGCAVEPPHGAERSDEHALFARQGYVVIRGLLEAAVTDFLWSYAHTKLASFLLSVTDRAGQRAPSVYGDPAFDGLLEYLRPRIERSCGRRLLPTYSYFRLYRGGDVLKRHRDRGACEFSVSLNLGQRPAEPWPLYVKGADGDYSARLEPGDGLLYRGIDLPHWREAYPGRELAQVFLHYVDRDGPHADQKFDGRATLMRPERRGDDGGDERPAG
jgi:hypothetical protein